MRQIVLDLEMTGLFVAEGHRVVEAAAIELVDGKETGRIFHSLIDPGRDIPEEVVRIHGISNEKVAGKPPFAALAKELRDFIGDAPVIITCRTHDGYTADIAFLNAEFERAGERPVPDSQWVNVRRWSEAMFGHEEARLDKVLDRYGVSRAERDAKGHGALLDARLLSEVYPYLLKEYRSFRATEKPDPKFKISP